MTAEGYGALEKELKHRQQVERPRIIQQITDARTHGDLSENAEYHAAKETQSHNETRIAELEDKLARAEVIDVSKLSGDTIKFGATVRLVDEDTDKKQVWQLVGEPEADAKKGKISITSPLARSHSSTPVGSIWSKPMTEAASTAITSLSTIRLRSAAPPRRACSLRH